MFKNLRNGLKKMGMLFRHNANSLKNKKEKEYFNVPEKTAKKYTKRNQEIQEELDKSELEILKLEKELRKAEIEYIVKVGKKAKLKGLNPYFKDLLKQAYLKNNSNKKSHEK